MMKHIKHFVVPVILLVLMLLTALLIQPERNSVTVHFRGLEQQTYYVTLLSDVASTDAWGVGSDPGDTMEPASRRAWEKFSGFQDPDQYFFLGYLTQPALEQETFSWHYCPPTTYKILVYFPEYDTFACSDSYHSYAFDSIYTVEVPQWNSEAGSEASPLIVYRCYPFGCDGWAAAARVALMLAADLAIALLVGFRSRKQLMVVAGTGFVLHMVQNFLLVYAYMQAGRWAFLGLYFCYGVFVFLAEGAVYGKSLPLLGREEKALLSPWGFAATGSLAAFVLGILATGWIQPGIFW